MSTELTQEQFNKQLWYVLDHDEEVRKTVSEAFWRVWNGIDIVPLIEEPTGEDDYATFVGFINEFFKVKSNIEEIAIDVFNTMAPGLVTWLKGVLTSDQVKDEMISSIGPASSEQLGLVKLPTSSTQSVSKQLIMNVDDNNNMTATLSGINKVGTSGSQQTQIQLNVAEDGTLTFTNDIELTTETKTEYVDGDITITNITKNDIQTDNSVTEG